MKNRYRIEKAYSLHESDTIYDTQDKKELTLDQVVQLLNNYEEDLAEYEKAYPADSDWKRF
jgi:hypothetical protein